MSIFKSQRIDKCSKTSKTMHGLTLITWIAFIIACECLRRNFDIKRGRECFSDLVRVASKDKPQGHQVVLEKVHLCELV